MSSSRTRQPGTGPETLAVELAALARRAQTRLRDRSEGPAGAPRGELVQTLFYGLFAAWVLARRREEAADFHWHDVRRVLPGAADPVALGIADLLDRAADTLRRADGPALDHRFRQADLVGDFYEPFLQRFDPDRRKALGVWYTPRELVRYQVERVDRALRDELSLAAGLADPRVHVLDPCCGTGAYLVEALGRILRTDPPKHGPAPLERLHGFDVLAAPLVIARLQLSLTLADAGSAGPEEARFGLHHADALTGWQELTASLDDPDVVWVVLGNPPYNVSAPRDDDADTAPLEPYTRELAARWNIRKHALRHELYVRFFRLAEQLVAERAGRGVVSYVSSFSYLRERSFVAMREHLRGSFHRIWIDCLNGDRNETGKVAPDGAPDPSAFSTPQNPEGIRKGTAVATMVRRDAPVSAPAEVLLRDLWGATKRTQLEGSLETRDPDTFRALYRTVEPRPDDLLSFRPTRVSADYPGWPSVAELGKTFQTFKENRGGALVDLDRERLATRMRAFLDPACPFDELADSPLLQRRADYDPRAVRELGLRRAKYDDSQIRPYLVRPFELRWCYYSRTPRLWNSPRPELWTQHRQDNQFLASRVSSEKAGRGAGSPVLYTRRMTDYQALARNVSVIPFRLYGWSSQGIAPNLRPAAGRYLMRLGFSPDPGSAELLWLHVLATAHAPAYLDAHDEALARDWPRIPLPEDRDRLIASARLGRRVADLLDPEQPLGDAEAGAPAVKRIGEVTFADDGARDLGLTEPWGRRTDQGVMPGRGRLTRRAYKPGELRDVEDPGAWRANLGDATCDIHANGTLCWRNVPERVWDHTIGGFQVLKKWLSYRGRDVVERDLTDEELRWLPDTARRIALLLLLGEELDQSYHATRAHPAPRSNPA